jgi:hypothetical protein
MPMARYLLEHCKPDLEFINKMVDSGALARLEQVGGGEGWEGRSRCYSGKNGEGSAPAVMGRSTGAVDGCQAEKRSNAVQGSP